jgi:multidrug transporter EmrE-like cation transporter
MSTPLILVLIAVCFSVTGELLLKTGMNRVGVLSLSTLGPTLTRMLGCWPLYAGLGAVICAAVFWLAAISRVELSWAYPLLATGYVLVLMFSALVLGETVSPARWVGALLIAIGVILVSRS